MEATEVVTPVEEAYIDISGAKEHNLQNIDLRIPREKMTVITGLSGSGKSSLAFDTLYAEGQRRYIETFSSYVRSFLGGMERPAVDRIQGLSPVISIEQKTISKNPRSTVGTVTEVNDFLRLLFARAGEAYSYKTGERMVRYSEEGILELIRKEFEGRKTMILAPVVKGRKGHYRELFERILRQGFLRARVDGEIIDLAEGTRVDRYKVHDIEIVIDRVQVKDGSMDRIASSCRTAMKHGKGMMLVQDAETSEVRHFSRSLMCPTTGISYDDPEPNLFSFNSPYGACSHCNGLGSVSDVDMKAIVPDPGKSIAKGGIEPLGKPRGEWLGKQIQALLEKYDHDLDTPIEDIPDELFQKVLNGTNEELRINTNVGVNKFTVRFEGVLGYLKRQMEDNSSRSKKKWAEQFYTRSACPECNGDRLRKEALHFLIGGQNIAQVSRYGFNELREWLENVEDQMDEKQKRIARDILKEIRERVGFLLEVGLYYLTLDRPARTLSGGEAQRIRLATQIGSKLTGVLYILDEPSIGLHQRDNKRLIDSLKDLRDIGNSVIVVEHDKETILSADHVVDMGPGAGTHGGHVVAEGKAADMQDKDTLTADYLFGRKRIEIPAERRPGNGKELKLLRPSGHNLKGEDVAFPLNKFICVTGVSGSGKSSLIDQTLFPELSAAYTNSKKKPLPHKGIEGLENVDKVIDIDQSPIGRTPRSNPATYTGVFTDIRALFAETPEARIRGYKPGRFSFNVKGGRCETCKGAGVKTIEMNFLPDVHVLCETCQGKRYNRETLEVRFKGKSISDVLDLTIEKSVEFFADIPHIHQKLKTLSEVGLGYLQLGQPSTTLSGGEAQRVKLATELARKGTGNTFYILDEPTTGLHFEDIRLLITVLNELIDQGNTVLVIEHDLDIVKVADHVIDLGPEGGEEGGWVLFEGTPEELANKKGSHTGEYLKKELEEGSK